MSQVQQCWNCGTENPAGARFCLNCGVALTSDRAPADVPGFTQETRKVITVLFVDLVGSTGLTERLDPEDAREVVGKFYRVAGHAVERFGGRIANLLGDAVLAIFGIPTTHEDDPERAVRGALALREALPALNEHLQATHGLSIDIRVGVNTGEVVAASGSTFDRDFLISDAVTTAARLQQTGSAGSIVVGERTYRLTHDAIEYREMPPVEVKGKATPLRVFAAVAARQERIDERVVAPLVGRQGELMMLRSLFDRSREAATVHVATLLGEPGVGKSRLVREFLAAVQESAPETLILRGRSTAFGEQIGYHALVDILQTQAGLMGTDPPSAIASKLKDWIRSTLPSREDLHGGLVLTFGAVNDQHQSPEARRRVLLESWRLLLVELSAHRPVVVAFEDLHWADDGIFDLIRMLVEGPADGAVLVLCIGRPELLERHPGWGQGWRNSLIIDLKPLRASETEQLVASLGGQRLSEEIRRVVTQRAEGNPLFAEEMVRMLIEGGNSGGASHESGATVPETVQAVLTARIDRLPTDQRRALQAAAVIGKTFWPGATATLTGTPSDEALGAVRELVGRALIVSRPTSTVFGEPEFAFRHILTRDVAYQLLPRTQRQRAHAQAAQWLEEKLGPRVEESVEILAEHFRLAGDHGRAADYLHRAANKARRQYANSSALHLFDEALEAAQRAGLVPQVLADLYLGRGEVHHLLAHYTMALSDFETGRDHARRSGDRALG